METIEVREKYQITLPTVIREAAGVYEGDFLTAQVRADRTILLRPSRLRDADEAFYYTPAWQAAEREADEDLAAGTVERTDERRGDDCRPASPAGCGSRDGGRTRLMPIRRTTRFDKAHVLRNVGHHDEMFKNP